MKISTKGRYGLRAMVDLAAHSKDEHVSIKSIAERQSISENYLEQVFSSLRKAGLVKSIKGAQGGYILGNDPDKILVGEILRALEGSLEIVDTKEEESRNSTTVDKIIFTYVWNTINECINGIVDSVSLQTLVEEYKRNGNSDSYIYFI